MAIMQLNRVFYRICVKIWNINEIDSLKEDVAIIVCLLEKEFPPTLFDIMIHLLLHVVEELDVCGIVL